MRMGRVTSNVLRILLLCLIVGSTFGWAPNSVNASSAPSIIDVGLTPGTKTYPPPETFLRARPGDRFMAWYDIAYSGPRMTIKIRTTIIDPSGTEIRDPIGDPFLVLMEDVPEHTGWVGDDFEIPDTVALGTYDVKFSVWSEDGAEEYDSITQLGWLEIFSGDEPDIRTPIGSIDYDSVLVGENKNGIKPIWNDGTATLIINSITRTSGSSDFAYIGPSTPFEIQSGGLSTITIRFSPSSEGTKSAIFTINSNDPDEANVTLSVSGSGITQTGTIEVTSDPSGFPFILSGPMDYSGPTPWSNTGAPLGTYTITWPPMSGYQAPPQESKTLTEGGTISFYGTYTPTEETITTPSTPAGPSSGEIGESLAYTTGGASSNLGHSIQYRFDWGDGTYSSWSSSTTASHSWSDEDTYTVRAQARCATHTSIVSDWSSGLSVSILSGTGTINVTSTPSDAPFTLSGLANYSGITPWSTTDAPVGTYTITWGFMSGYETPLQESKKLMGGETISFHVTYPAVLVRIDSYSAKPREVVVGDPTELSFRFTNAGDVPRTFYAAVSLRKPNGEEVHLPLKPVSVNPSEQGSATWTYPIDMEGDWDVVFGLWEEESQKNSLDHTGWLYDYIIATLENEAPAANAGSNQLVSSGDLVTFDGSNSDDPDGKIVSYQWDFGDSTTAAGQIISHRFRGAMNESKAYTVTLTVVDDKGTVATDTASITVQPLQNTVIVEGTGYQAGVTALYNWVKVGESGEDIYIVSKITAYAGLFTGACEIDIHDGDTGISIWRNSFISYGSVQERTWFSPFATKEFPLGINCQIKKLTFPGDAVEAIEIFEGIEVDGYDAIDLMVGGATVVVSPVPGLLKPELVLDGAERKLYPGSPVEYLGPAAKLYFDLLLALAFSPVELRVYDSQGNVTGLVNGEVKEEIPNSAYDEETKTVVILCPFDSYRHEMAGTSEGSYDLAVATVAEQTSIFTLSDVPTSASAVHEYTIDWDALSEGEKGITMKIDSDGDGSFERVINLSGIEEEKEGLPMWAWISIGVAIGFAIAFGMWRRMGKKQTAQN